MENRTKDLLRVIFIYFVIQVVPLDWKYYAYVFSIEWTGVSYGEIFELTRYYPRFLPAEAGFYNWLIAAVLAFAAAVIWKMLEKRTKPIDYNALYYWLRVLLRYRLAVGVVGYALLKLFLLQAPFPSLSNLNTSYGSFTTWKIFSLSLGAAPVYEVFLGSVELLAGLLLLFRRTAAIGAFIIICFIGNVFLSNLAYEGGEYVYSLYLLIIALFLFAFDARRLFDLLSLNKTVLPDTYRPILTERQRLARHIAKGGFFLVFVVFYGIKAYEAYSAGSYHFPKQGGLANVSGIYNVKEFVLNDDTISYTLDSTQRWDDVVFEKWPTISIRSRRQVVVDSSNTEQFTKADQHKDYELIGSGERHYYHYEADTASGKLRLRNKNKNYPGENLEFKFSRPDSLTIFLSGKNETGDSIKVILEKTDRKYLIIEGRRKPIKL